MAISLPADYVIEKYKSIQQLVDQHWNCLGAWQDFIGAMRQTFPAQTALNHQDLIVLRLTMLPGLCCEAAGGQFEWADPIAAAWLLFYNSAHIYDNIEDEDSLDPCWSVATNGVAINAASGMIFSAYLCLQDLNKTGVGSRICNRIVEDFSNSLLIMSGGQHQDLVERIPGLDNWYRTAGSKSGEFFALACRSGAQLATEDQEAIQQYSEFGYQLGLLMQLLDDVGDYVALQQGEMPVQREALTRSLVAAYCMEVSPVEIKQQLRVRLAGKEFDRTTLSEIMDLLNRCGADLYLATEFAKRRQYGLEALNSAGARGNAKERLSALLVDLSDSAPSSFLRQ